MMFCMRQTFIELHSLMSVLFNFLPLIDLRLHGMSDPSIFYTQTLELHPEVISEFKI